jgi:hypothetical protein
LCFDFQAPAFKFVSHTSFIFIDICTERGNGWMWRSVGRVIRKVTCLLLGYPGFLKSKRIPSIFKDESTGSTICNARVVLQVIKPRRQVVTRWLRVAWEVRALDTGKIVGFAATSYFYDSAPISGVILNVIIKPITID